MEIVLMVAAFIVGVVSSAIFMRYYTVRHIELVKKDIMPEIKETPSELEHLEETPSELEKPEKTLTDWDNSSVNIPPTKGWVSLVGYGDWTFEDLFEKLDAFVKERHEYYYVIGYEGATFKLECDDSNDYMSLVYFNICFTNYRFLYNALKVANELNQKNDLWYCYLKILPDGEDEHPVRVSFKCRIEYSEDIEDSAQTFREAMHEAFSISREFNDSFKETKKLEEFDKPAAEDMDFYNKVAFLERRKEIKHGKFTKPRKSDDHDSILIFQLISHFDYYDLGNVLNMRVSYSNCVETFEDECSIIEFNIYQFLKDHAEPNPIDHLTIEITYEKQVFCINVCRLEGSAPKTLYYMIYVTQLPVAGSALRINPIAHSYQTMLEICLSEENAAYWEVRYMLDDAKDKISRGNRDKLTEEQLLMVSVMDSSLQYDMYLGKKMYNDKAYSQALEHFMKIFRYYTYHWKQVTKEDKSLFRKISLFIGMIYMDWHFPERAYYYLSLAKDTNSIASIQEYVNSLCEINDPRAASEISFYLFSTMAMMKQSEDVDVSIKNLYAFLCKRMAYSLINLGDIERAEIFLNQMIKEGVEVLYAQDELDYLKAKRLAKSFKSGKNVHDKLHSRKKAKENGDIPQNGSSKTSSDIQDKEIDSTNSDVSSKTDSTDTDVPSETDSTDTDVPSETDSIDTDASSETDTTDEDASSKTDTTDEDFQ